MALPAAATIAAGNFDAQRIIRPPGRHYQALLAIRRTISIAATLPAQWPTWANADLATPPLQHVKNSEETGFQLRLP